MTVKATKKTLKALALAVVAVGVMLGCSGCLVIQGIPFIPSIGL